MIADSIIARLLLWAEVKPQETAFSFVESARADTKNITYFSLLQRTLAVADVLHEKGLNGKTCLLFFDDREAFIYAFLGCLMANAIPVPLKKFHLSKNNDFITSIFNNVQPSGVIYLGRMGLVEEASNLDLPGPIQWIDWQQIQHQLLSQPLKEAVNMGGLTAQKINDVAYIQFTSGSITAPKGTIITHRNIVSNQLMIKDAFGHNEDTIMVSWLPHYHDMGLVGTILHPLYMGFVCIHFPTTHFVKYPLNWLKIISRFKATCSGGPNFAYDLCVNKALDEELRGIDLSTWKTAFNGSEPVKAQTIKQFTHIFSQYGFSSTSYFPVYGLAEATLFVSGARDRFLTVCQNGLQAGEIVPLGERDRFSSVELVACGKVQCIQQPQHFSIQDNKSGRTLAPYQIGQVVIAGAHVSPGYWPPFSPESYQCYSNIFATSDLGFIDDKGYLYITGRKEDLFIINGRKIYAHDVESQAQTLAKNLLPMNSCYSFLINRPFQRLILAFEARRSSDAEDFDFLAKQIIEACHLTFGVTPHLICLVKKQASFRTSSGKKKRALVRSKYLNDELVFLNEYPSSNKPLVLKELGNIMLDKIDDYFLEMVAEKAKINIHTLAMDASLFQYGFDSLTLLALICDLEKRFKVNVPMEIFYTNDSLQSVATALLSYYQKPNEFRCIYGVQTEYQQRLDGIEHLIKSVNPLVCTTIKPSKILLTGATGFLGVHLLVELLLSQEIEVFCLIRARNHQHALDRLVKNLCDYDFNELSSQLMLGAGSRVHLLCGDVSEVNFGLDHEAYQALSCSIDAVLHCAAIDNFFLPYQALYQANVVGTEHIVEFSLTDKIKHLHHISSCAAALVDAEHLDDPDQGLLNGYAKTKFMSEHIVLKALDHGLVGGCYRLGYLFSGRNGLIDETDAFENILAVFPKLGYFPAIDTQFDLTPVEYVCRCVLDDLFHPSQGSVLKRYYNPVKLKWYDLYDSFSRKGIRLKRVALPEFVSYFKEYVRFSSEMSLKALSPIISKQLEHQLNRMFVDGTTSINHKYLQDCPPCDTDFSDRFIKTILDYASRKSKSSLEKQ